MSWGSLDDFLAMGGYGLYVWGSYAMALFCISLEVLFLRMTTRK